MKDDLLVTRSQGLYCAAGDFYIDPWRPVERAIITHAHADHARVGHWHYLAAEPGGHVLRTRLGAINLQTVRYGESLTINGVKVTLYPAGHVLGSSQVRVEYGGQVWVVSGDYKLDPDPTCDAFEPVRCDTFVTESTFGLPIYRWPAPPMVFAAINDWWRRNAQLGRTSVLFCYSFGKAQRILAGIDPSIGPIVCHGAIAALNAAYVASKVALPATLSLAQVDSPQSLQQAQQTVQKKALQQALVLAPPSASGATWLRRFGDHSDAFASGWMLLRGARRRRALDRGFVLSDHADWPGLVNAIRATQAEQIIVTHGQVAVMVRWLVEQGLKARSFATEFGDEGDDAEATAPSASATTD